MKFWRCCSPPPVPQQPPPHLHLHHNLFPASSSSSRRLHLLPRLTPPDQPIKRFPLCLTSLPPPRHGRSLFSPLRSVALPSLHHSFHLVGSLSRPVVAEREPDPRPLSLAPPTIQRGGASPVQRTVLTRANSLPSHGHRFPVLPAGEARRIGGRLQDERGPRL